MTGLTLFLALAGVLAAGSITDIEAIAEVARKAGVRGVQLAVEQIKGEGAAEE